MLYVHMYPGISAMEIKNPPEVWKPTMEKARAIRSSSGARSAAAASSRSAASAARRLSFTGPGHNFWREFLQEDVKREIQQVGKPCWFGMMFFFSSFFWGKHGETANPIFFWGELDILGNIGFGWFWEIFLWGAAMLITSWSYQMSWKGWEKTDTLHFCRIRPWQRNCLTIFVAGYLIWYSYHS